MHSVRAMCNGSHTIRFWSTPEASIKCVLQYHRMQYDECKLPGMQSGNGIAGHVLLAWHGFAMERLKATMHVMPAQSPCLQVHVFDINASRSTGWCALAIMKCKNMACEGKRHCIEELLLPLACSTDRVVMPDSGYDTFLQWGPSKPSFGRKPFCSSITCDPACHC